LSTAGNKMFAQWWRDAKVLSTFILQRFPTRTVAASRSHHCANTNVGSNFIRTMRRLGLLTLVFLVTSCDYFTDQKVIVRDKSTGQPIDSVKVSIKGWDLMTDSLGFCHFNGVTGDLTTRPITAEKNGYKKFQITIDLDGDFVTYKQRIDSTYTHENSFGAMTDTLIIYLVRK
jgi:hypothetical protein